MCGYHLGSTTLDSLDFIPASSQSISSLVFKRIAFIELQISILSFMVVLKYVLIYLDTPLSKCGD